MCLPVAANEQLWAQLAQDSNMIVLLRNSESQGNRDGSNLLVWDASGNCAGESTLTEAGKAHARRIGAAFASRGIEPVAISSPMCRCSETAKIAFGRYRTDPDLRQRPPGDESAQAAMQAKTAALLTALRGNRPVAFVNHRPNIDALTLELLELGELLVGRIDEDGEIEIEGRLRID